MNTALRKAFSLQSKNQLIASLINRQPIAQFSNRKPGLKGNNLDPELEDDVEIDFDQLKDDIQKVYKQKFKNIQLETEKIIGSYERGIEMADEDIETQQLKIKNKKLQEATQKHFSDIPLKEFMNRSKKLADSLRLKTAWSPYDKPDAYQNTFDYEKYQANQVKREDVTHDPDDAGEYDGRTIEAFMAGRAGEPEIVNKTEDKAAQGPVSREQARRDKDDAMTARIKRFIEFGDDLSLTKWDKLIPGRIDDGTGHGYDTENWPLRVDPVLSERAKNEIYQLHLKGWSVRDLSVRFGIMPQRVKAVIWMTQTFYDEYLPRMSIKHVLELTRALPNLMPNTVDYGLDLQYMAKAKQGVSLRRFRMKAEDLNPSGEQAEKMEKLLLTKRRKNWDMVTEDFVGRGSRGYFIKSWHVYRGHGSERVNKKFKNIIQHSDRPHLLPKKVRKALEEGKGPRIASLGWGIK